MKTLWKRLETLEPGKRFQTLHREQRDRPPAVIAAFFVVAIACFAVGLVFVSIPGPAILFFALGGALLATQSFWVARVLDAAEIWGRKARGFARAAASVGNRRRPRRSSPRHWNE
jgi:hypothetical protein